jgi:membrane protease YdiL (CAAX protease family)
MAENNKLLPIKQPEVKKRRFRFGLRMPRFVRNHHPIQFSRRRLHSTRNWIRKTTTHYWVITVISLSIATPPLFYLWRPIVGVYADAAALALLLTAGIYAPYARKLTIAAAILPISAITTVCLPHVSVFVRITVYYATVLLFSLLYRYLFSLDAPDQVQTSLGKKYVFSIPSMVVVGELLGGLGYIILRHQYAYKGVSLELIAPAAIVFAFAEEMLFQGLIQELASRIMNPKLAVVLVVICYSFTTVSYTNNLPLIFGLISGIVLAITYYLKKNLLLTTAVNALMKLTYIGLVATFILH